ncbi:MAG: hypothetical protein M3036_09500, partial [Bifidobacteriales bacterium]|nr:hypothetical protein [Bifidobacteriales bacterium]
MTKAPSLTAAPPEGVRVGPETLNETENDHPHPANKGRTQVFLTLVAQTAPALAQAGMIWYVVGQ